MRNSTRLRLMLCVVLGIFIAMDVLSPKSPLAAVAVREGTCCVTCDGLTVCAASVSMYCGSCDGGGGGGNL